MRAWTEVEIDSDIFRHGARNLQLRRRLAERGIDFRGDAQSRVTSGRLAKRQASRLEQGLIERRFLSVGGFPCSVGGFSYLARSSTGPTNPRPSLEPRIYRRDGPVCSRVVMCLGWLVHRYLTSAT